MTRSGEIWDELDQSIDLALNNIHDIIITGDFNINQLSDNHRNKISSLLIQYSVQQLITETTYMTEHSSSLLDLVMVNNPTSVLYTEFGFPLLNQVRYHLPITGVLNHPTIVNASFKRKIFLYDKGDYESYRNLLSVVDWDGIFRNDDIDIITNTITNTILDAANKTIPNRYITVKKDNPPWITTKIKKSTYAVKIEFTKKQRKQSYFDKISEKINTERNGNKNWWNVVKSLLHSSTGLYMYSVKVIVF